MWADKCLCRGMEWKDGHLLPHLRSLRLLYQDGIVFETQGHSGQLNQRSTEVVFHVNSIHTSAADSLSPVY